MVETKFVVEVGEYSGRWLLALFSTREKAEAAINRVVAESKRREESSDGISEIEFKGGESIYNETERDKFRIHEIPLDPTSLWVGDGDFP